MKTTYCALFHEDLVSAPKFPMARFFALSDQKHLPHLLQAMILESYGRLAELHGAAVDEDKISLALGYHHSIEGQQPTLLITKADDLDRPLFVMAEDGSTDDEEVLCIDDKGDDDHQEFFQRDIEGFSGNQELSAADISSAIVESFGGVVASTLGKLLVHYSEKQPDVLDVVNELANSVLELTLSSALKSEDPEAMMQQLLTMVQSDSTSEGPDNLAEQLLELLQGQPSSEDHECSGECGDNCGCTNKHLH